MSQSTEPMKQTENSNEQPRKKKRRWVRWLKRVGLSILALVGTYLLILLVGLIPVNSDFQETPDGIEIFITSNGVHADIVMPIKTELVDWRNHFQDEHFTGGTAAATHVAVGWGDKGFYLQTPTWDDLKMSTACRALFTPSPCCMHTAMVREPEVSEDVRSVTISRTQYETMTRTILGCFKKKDGQIQHIADSGYRRYDTFYEARGNYHILNTCNSWVGWVMRTTGLKTPLLTPMPKTVFLYLPELCAQVSGGKGLTISTLDAVLPLPGGQFVNFRTEAKLPLCGAG